MTEREPLENDSPSVSSPKTIDERDSGVIQGAFGTIRLEDRTPRRTWRGRLLTLAAIIGPGIIVLVGDNDAGGVATYAQAGQNFGYSLLWTLLLLVPVLIVNQEMVVRLGAVTGVGLAKLITERFGRFWGWYSVGGLFLLNFMVISTEFIGVTLAAEYFGFNRYVVVPLATIVLIGITISGNFRRWERSMFVFLFGSLLVLPLAALSHPDARRRAGNRETHRSGDRRDLRPAAARRLHRRRIGGDARHLVCVRRHLRRAPVAQPAHRRGTHVLRQLHRDGRARGRPRAHPGRAARHHHHRGAGARGHPASERDSVRAPAVQRRRGPRSVDQQAVAERGRGADRRRAARAVGDPRPDHRLSFYQCRGPGHRARGFRAGRHRGLGRVGAAGAEAPLRPTRDVARRARELANACPGPSAAAEVVAGAKSGHRHSQRLSRIRDPDARRARSSAGHCALGRLNNSLTTLNRRRSNMVARARFPTGPPR